MRSTWLPALIFIAFSAAAACKREESAFSPVRPEATALSTDSRAAGDASDSGRSSTAPGSEEESDRTPESVAKPVALSAGELAAFVRTSPDAGLEEFAGFSADERRFAWSAYSVGAGAHVLTMISVGADERSDKWLLDEEQLPRARAALSDGGFTAQRRVLATDAGQVLLEIEGRTVRLDYVTPSRAAHTFYEGDPFGEGGFGVPEHAAFWGLSPSGRLAVLETVSASHAEFGSAKSFVFVPIRVEEGSR